MFAAPVVAFSPSVVSSPPLSIGGCKQTGELDDHPEEDDFDDAGVDNADADAEDADDDCTDDEDADDDFVDNDYSDDDNESILTILTVTI